MELKKPKLDSVSKTLVYKLVFSVVIAFINAVCTQAVVSHACFGWDYLGRRSWGLYFAVGLVVSFLFFCAMDFLMGIVRHDGDIRVFNWLPVVFVLCWLPYLITYYPGLVNYDTVNQILDFLDGVAPVPFGFVGGQEEVTVLFNAHHPVFVTLIFGAFIKLGILLGNPSLGLALFIIVQMVVAAFIFSYVINGAATFFGITDLKLELFFVAFFAICPIIPYYICIMLKNSMHSLILVLYVFLYLKMTLAEHVLDKREKILWVITALLLPLTQNTGIYFVILTCILPVIKGVKENRKFLGIVLAAVVAVMLLITKAVYPAMNIFPGGKQEMLGTLFQQTGRYVRDYYDEVTEEEIQIISKVLNYETLVYEYDFETSDPIKATYNLHVSGEDLRSYYKLWLRQGLRHPDAYFRAILPICGQFFAFGYDVGIFDHIPTDEGIFAQIQHVKPIEDYTVLTEWYYWAEKFPGIDILFQHALYTLWIPLFCLYRTIVEKKKRFMYLVPYVVNVLFVIVSPMGYSRYALPLIFTSPLLLFIILGRKKDKGD